MNGFEIADGSVIGRAHVGRGKILKGGNNQDAFAWYEDDKAIVAVVCDGCGSGHFSEFGARLGAVSFIAAAQQFLTIDISIADLLDLAFVRVISTLKNAVHSFLPNSFTATTAEVANIVHHQLLFTMVGVVIRADTTCVFSIGDGVYFANGEKHIIEPHEGNMPPYIAYNIVPPEHMMSEHYDHFIQQYYADTAGIDSILIGTDGVVDLIQAEEQTIPGKKELVEPISQFWEDDRYFQNPVAIDRRLHCINRESHRVIDGLLEYESGLLPDDTTFIVIRRTV